MKVICAYCDSYVETDDKEICPRCGASLAQAIRKAQQELLEEDRRAKEAELQQKKEEREAEETSRMLDIAAMVLGIGSRSGVLRKYIRRYIFDEIRSSFRR